MTDAREIQDYARGVLNFGGIFAAREKDGAFTQKGVVCAAIRMTIVGYDENEIPTTIVANLTRDQVSEMINALSEILIDG
jgi:7-keto-8-aminopelargonate synthetase-like enzyme